MATWNEYIAQDLRKWREAERRLRRLNEDGQDEGFIYADTERACAEAFRECVERVYEANRQTEAL